MKSSPAQQSTSQFTSRHPHHKCRCPLCDRLIEYNLHPFCGHYSLIWEPEKTVVLLQESVRFESSFQPDLGQEGSLSTELTESLAQTLHQWNRSAKERALISRESVYTCTRTSKRHGWKHGHITVDHRGWGHRSHAQVRPITTNETVALNSNIPEQQISRQ